MVSIASLLVFIAFYALYNTSKRAHLSNVFPLEKWIQENPKYSKITGLSLLFLGYAILLFEKAIGCSTLIFFIQIMTIGSLVVILAPLRIINNKFIIALFTISIFIEFYH